MPVVFAAVPVAALLAWLAMKAGGPKRSSREPMSGGGLEGGDTGQLSGSRRREEDPWKRDELPESSGGEVGGPYGPASNAEAPSAISSYEAPPGPTQTVLMAAPAYHAPTTGSVAYHAPTAGTAQRGADPAPAPAPVATHGASSSGVTYHAPPPMPAGHYE